MRQSFSMVRRRITRETQTESRKYFSWCGIGWGQKWCSTLLTPYSYQKWKQLQRWVKMANHSGPSSSTDQLKTELKFVARVIGLKGHHHRMSAFILFSFPRWGHPGILEEIVKEWMKKQTKNPWILQFHLSTKSVTGRLMQQKIVWRGQQRNLPLFLVLCWSLPNGHRHRTNLEIKFLKKPIRQSTNMTFWPKSATVLLNFSTNAIWKQVGDGDR